MYVKARFALLGLLTLVVGSFVVVAQLQKTDTASEQTYDEAREFFDRYANPKSPLGCDGDDIIVSVAQRQSVVSPDGKTARYPDHLTDSDLVIDITNKRDNRNTVIIMPTLLPETVGASAIVKYTNGEVELYGIDQASKRLAGQGFTSNGETFTAYNDPQWLQWQQIITADMRAAYEACKPIASFDAFQ